ncbi:jg23065 [Pararge aegeria aegeria]|uniref:Jg23065 protein n=1 Tax=Pararge aegeria aegeria TaxID=348720 RepID=A0A8S4S2L1_9NEOP|nr:jg23065 [Pararge aegeria aegeria]
MMMMDDDEGDRAWDLRLIRPLLTTAPGSRKLESHKTPSKPTESQITSLLIARTANRQKFNQCPRDISSRAAISNKNVRDTGSPLHAARPTAAAEPTDCARSGASPATRAPPPANGGAGARQGAAPRSGRGRGRRSRAGALAPLAPREPLEAEPSSGVECCRSDVRGGRRLLAVSGGGAAGAERSRAGDEPVAQIGAAAEPVAAAAAALNALLRHRHPVAHRGVPQAGAGQQPAVAVQVRGSIGGGALHPLICRVAPKVSRALESRS